MLRQAWLALALLPWCSAFATPVTFEFAGVIDNDPFGVFDSASFTGSYTFDSAMPRVLDTADSGGYADSGAFVDMRVAFTGVLDASVNGPFVADALNIAVDNGAAGVDRYLVTGRSSTDSELSVELTLVDPTGTAFSSTSLPLSPPAISAFQTARFALFDTDLEAEGSVSVIRCVEGCAVTTVPEPAIADLLAAALVAVGVARVRRHPSKGNT